MSSFTGNIQLEQLGKTDNCLVLKDFSYYTNDRILEFVIKKGFITDLASIKPITFALSFIPFLGIFLAAALRNRYWRAFALHDMLYRTGWVSQYQADVILDESLEVLGANKATREIIYRGLRMFGSPTDNPDLIENAIKHSAIIETDVYYL